MTNYNERLDRVLSDYAEAMGSYVNFGSPFNSDEENIAGAEALYQTSHTEAKQALTQLIADEVREAVWKEKERIYEFATRKQANGLYVPIELGIEPWLREQL